jgi:hypothetical protein
MTRDVNISGTNDKYITHYANSEQIYFCQTPP